MLDPNGLGNGIWVYDLGGCYIAIQVELEENSASSVSERRTQILDTRPVSVPEHIYSQSTEIVVV